MTSEQSPQPQSPQDPRPSLAARAVYAAPALVIALLVAIAVVGLAAPGPLQRFVRNGSAIEAPEVDLSRMLAAFEATLPRESYDEPTPAEAETVAAAFRAVEADQLKRAARLAQAVDYRLVGYTDRVTDRRLVLLTEDAAESGRRGRGWGMYIHSPESRSRLIIEVAHPVADVMTLELGLEIFRATDASSLFVAGAHRDAGSNDSADVAHNPRTVFEAVHSAAVGAGSTVIQPHGFEATRRPESFGDLVISSGAAPTDVTRSIAGRLSAAGFSVCLFGRDRCEGLGGTTNVQGRSSRTAGAEFVHLELARHVRESPSLRARLNSALAGELR